MTISNTQTLFQSFDRALMEELKVYRNGGIGSEGSFVVVNHENVDAYVVEVEEGIIKKCTCPHSHYRKACCKHMIKVAFIHNMDIEQLTRP